MSAAGCAVCGAEIPTVGPGRRAKYCLAHRTSKNRARDLRRLAAREGDSAAAHVASAIGATPRDDVRRATRAIYPQLLAVSLGLIPDAARAAEAAGVRWGSAAELAELERMARTEHADLIEGKQAALGTILHRAVTILSLNAIAKAAHMTPASAGAAARSLAQVLELVTGGTKPVYSHVTLTVTGPDGTTDTAG